MRPTVQFLLARYTGAGVRDVTLFQSTARQRSPLKSSQWEDPTFRVVAPKKLLPVSAINMRLGKTD